MKLPLQMIVVPVDLSDDSLAAVDVAQEMATTHTRVHVVHVLPELQAADPGIVWQTMDNELRRRHATQALRERFSGVKYQDLQVSIEFGDAGYRIAQLAEDLKADLIVMPSRGRTGLKHLVIGSVAERVVRLAHCGVLVLKN
jgi:nucleotide-binding universal stress UspA family protein